MNLTNLIRLNAVVTLAFGGVLLVWTGRPDVLAFYGIAPPAGTWDRLQFDLNYPMLPLFVRFFGATASALGIALWALGDVAKIAEARHQVASVLLWGNFGFAVLLLPPASASYNVACWLTAAVPVAFAAGYVFFHATTPDSKPADNPPFRN